MIIISLKEKISLQLFIKSSIICSRIIKNYNGSVIIMNQNGEVIVNYSSPELTVYNHNINHKQCYLNKVIQCQYPPGSVFKIISSLTLLKLNICEKVTCNGFIYIGNRKFHCWKRTGHGFIHSIKDAIQKSCNIFLY